MEYTPDKIQITFPTSPELLTPQFLTLVLRENIHSVRVADSHIGDGMTGSLFRIALEPGRVSSRLPKTMIAKFSAFDDRVRAECNALGFFEREVYFYNNIAKNMNVRTPYCYYAAFDSRQRRSLLLLEDLAGYQMENWTKGCPIDRARQGIKEMARLHAAWWNRPGLQDIPWLFRFPGRIAPVFAEYWEVFRACLQLGDSPDILRLGEIIIQEVDGAVSHLEGAPITLIHNDFQLNNLAFNAPGSPEDVVMFDWATYTASKGGDDLAMFLVGSLAPEDRRLNEMTLIYEYVQDLSRAGVGDYPSEQCYHDYRQALLLHFSRLVLAISIIELSKGGAEKAISPRAFNTWSPIVRRHLAAVMDHHLAG